MKRPSDGAGDRIRCAGLGDDPAVEGVGVVWPGGRRELWSNVRVDGLITLREGSGAPWP